MTGNRTPLPEPSRHLAPAGRPRLRPRLQPRPRLAARPVAALCRSGGGETAVGCHGDGAPRACGNRWSRWQPLARARGRAGLPPQAASPGQPGPARRCCWQERQRACSAVGAVPGRPARVSQPFLEAQRPRGEIKGVLSQSLPLPYWLHR